MIKSTVKLNEILPDTFKELLESKGVTFVKRLGEENVRQVVIDVLCGNNLRASTEQLTRQRISKLNAATFLLYLRGIETAKNFSHQLPDLAATQLGNRSSKIERWICQWMLGLTEKGFQNILRDDRQQLVRYAKSFAAAMERVAAETKQDCGDLICHAKLSENSEINLDWHDLLSLFCVIGSQTLAIRGSDKSTYGKLFERLVLGSVLSALGFEQTSYPPTKTNKAFWLSSKIGAREADATVLVSLGKAIRFDLGFIGRGNPEITKDKVSRFERELEVNKKQYHSATCIIVDRVGESSTLVEQAKNAGAIVIQMSMSHWPVKLALWLQEKFNYKAELLSYSEADLGKFYQRRLKSIQFENFVHGLTTADLTEENENDSV